MYLFGLPKIKILVPPLGSKDLCLGHINFISKPKAPKELRFRHVGVQNAEGVARHCQNIAVGVA